MSFLTLSWPVLLMRPKWTTDTFKFEFQDQFCVLHPAAWPASFILARCHRRGTACNVHSAAEPIPKLRRPGPLCVYYIVGYCTIESNQTSLTFVQLQHHEYTNRRETRLSIGYFRVAQLARIFLGENRMNLATWSSSLCDDIDVSWHCRGNTPR